MMNFIKKVAAKAKEALNSFKQLLVPTVGLVVAGSASAQTAPSTSAFTVDTTSVVAVITNGVTTISAIGIAVLSLVVVIKLFKWAQRALS